MGRIDLTMTEGLVACVGLDSGEGWPACSSHEVVPLSATWPPLDSSRWWPRGGVWEGSIWGLRITSSPNCGSPSAVLGRGGAVTGGASASGVGQGARWRHPASSRVG